MDRDRSRAPHHMVRGPRSCDQKTAVPGGKQAPRGSRRAERAVEDVHSLRQSERRDEVIAVPEQQIFDAQM